MRFLLSAGTARPFVQFGFWGLGLIFGLIFLGALLGLGVPYLLAVVS